MFEIDNLRWRKIPKDITQPKIEKCAIQRAFDAARKAGRPITSILMVCKCKKCSPCTL